MIYKKMMIKLIDFGESYHPNIKSTYLINWDHQPGFSVPYSAPENYNFSTTYTHKNDIFSLGIILYELFLSKFPFFSYDEKKR
jgi:serine/threonine protein kinase